MIKAERMRKEEETVLTALASVLVNGCISYIIHLKDPDTLQKFQEWYKERSYDEQYKIVSFFQMFLDSSICLVLMVMFSLCTRLHR